MRNKLISASFVLMFLLVPLKTEAVPTIHNTTDTLLSTNDTSGVNTSQREQSAKEYILEDALFSLLSPFAGQAITQKFGAGAAKGTMCYTLLDIKKHEPGSMMFDVKLQFITFEGAHNPPYHKFIIDVKNGGVEGKWRLINVEVEEIPTDQVKNLPCRKPV